MNKEPLKIQMRKNPYIVWTFGLGVLVLLLIVANIVEVRTEKKIENEVLCSVISATPAWAADGKLLKYGAIIPENQSIDLVGVTLIPNGIKFLYNPDCSACEMQIDYFKEQGTWEAYVKEGLTIDCSKYR